MYDSLLVTQAATTNTVGTGATFNSTALDLVTTPQGHEVFDNRVTFPGSWVGTAAATATFYMGESSDNTTFYQCSRPQFVTLASGTNSNIQPLYLPFIRSQRYVRQVMTLSNTTSGLVAVYKGELGLARP